MAVQAFLQTTIAVIWDFDDTLISGSMQRPIFKKYDIDETSFWNEVNGLSAYYQARGNKVSQSSAYLNHMLTYIRDGLLPGLNNKKLEELGAEIEFFNGVPELFGALKNQVVDSDDFHRHDISVELYVVSSGLARMVKGSKISKYIDDIWGCEFIEDVASPGYISNQPPLIPEDAVLRQVGFIIDDTTKTRAIFEINKGVNKYPSIDVNSQIPFELRRVPFKNMIYIADGPSDIPVFSLLKQYGGRTYAVYEPESERHFDRVLRLRQQERVEAFGPADYSEGTQTYMWTVGTVKDIARRIVAEKEHALQASVQQPPGHVEATAPSVG